MAPIIPFMTEHIWQKLVRETEKGEEISIHLSHFPQVQNLGYDALLDQTQKVRDIIYLAQKLRAEHQIKVKQPLSKMLLKVSDDYKDAVKNFKQIILDEINVKDVEFVAEDDKFNDQSLILNFRKAGAVLKGDVNRLKQTLLEANAEDMKKYVDAVASQKDVEIAGFPTLTFDMFEIKLTPKKEFAIANLGNNLVVLDIEIDEALESEGKLRELIRELQVARKDAGLNIDDRIALNMETNSESLKKLIADNLQTITAEVLCTSTENFDGGFEKQIDIDDEIVNIKIKKN